MSDSLWPHGLQHTIFPCPSLSPGTCSNSCPLSRWCHPTTSSSVIPLSSFNLSQYQGLFKWSVLRIKWPKYWSFSFSISPSNEYSGLITFRMDQLDLLAVQGTQESFATPQFKSINSQLMQEFLVRLTESQVSFILWRWPPARSLEYLNGDNDSEGGVLFPHPFDLKRTLYLLTFHWQELIIWPSLGGRGAETCSPQILIGSFLLATKLWSESVDPCFDHYERGAWGFGGQLAVSAIICNSKSTGMLLFIYFLFLAVPCSVQDLSSPTRDLTPGPWQSKCQVLTNHWITGNFQG